MTSETVRTYSFQYQMQGSHPNAMGKSGCVLVTTSRPPSQLIDIWNEKKSDLPWEDWRSPQLISVSCLGAEEVGE